MNAPLVGAEVLCCTLLFATVFFAVVNPASVGGSPQAKWKLIMSIQTAADAMNAAASAVNTAAQSLTTAATALAGANDTAVLDAPVAALNDAVTNLNTAAAAITALVPAQ